MCLSSCAPCFIPAQDLAPHQGSGAWHLRPLGRMVGILARAWPHLRGPGKGSAQRSEGARRQGNPEAEDRRESLREGEGRSPSCGERLPQALGSPHLIPLGSEV